MKGPFFWCKLLLFFSLIFGQLLFLGYNSELFAATGSIMPFSEVKVGMIGVGRSVFQGYEIEEFPLEIIGVVPRTGPNENFIIARVGGPLLEKTGVISGMSGSPVYIADRLVGAIASTWIFAKEPLAGIRPIEQMLALTTRETGSQKVNSLITSSVFMDENIMNFDVPLFPSPFKVTNSDFRTGSELDFQPITCPLNVSGVSEKMLTTIKELFQPLGFLPVVSGNASGQHEEKTTLKPGAAVGVDLISGDMTMAAVGTVSYVDQDTVLAFAHPMLHLGSIEMPLSSAFVHAIIPSSRLSFKLASTTTPIGSMIQDRADGILAKLDQTAPMLPVSVEITNKRENRTDSFQFKVVQHERLAPVLTYLAVANTLFTLEKSSGEAAIQIKSRLSLENHEPIEVENYYSSFTALEEVGGKVFSLLAILTNPFEKVKAQQVSFTFAIDEEIKAANIQEIGLQKETLYPGENLEIVIFLQPYQSQAFTKKVSIPIGETWSEGKYILRVSDHLWHLRNDVRRAPFRYKPHNLQQFIDIVTQEQNQSKIYITLSHFKHGITLRGEEYNNIPASVLAVINPSPQTGNGSLVRESIIFEHLLATNYVISGFKSMRCEIRRKK
ncbi:SpoIVB peptidase S55 domain-containing protein [candidate division CSSED10-310 bacterium]|uniref:SpoIVB peptidase S55 domain-containing protein n=1 Tax=candidate division CSSED10-310 bacterium TaxID=2855610 RepID=A0ABV6YVM7_UNCC1